MAIDTISIDAISGDSFSILLKAGYSLRYELTCGVVLLLLWLMGQLAGIQQKRGKGDKLASKVASPLLPTSVPSPDKSSLRRPAPPSSSLRAVAPRAAEQTPAQPLELLGPISDIKPALLRDPAWLVPQVANLCRTKVQTSLELYRAALKAGLKLEDVPPAHCKTLFVALVTSSIRISQIDEAKQLLRDLRGSGLGIDPSLFSSVAKLCTSKHLFAECLAFFDFMAEDPSFALTDKAIWSCLLFCAIEVRVYQRCNHFWSQLKQCGAPSQKDFGNMIRLASLHGDWQLSLSLIKEMQQSPIEIDSVIYNTSLATCVGADQVDQARGLLEEMKRSEGVTDVITYNTLMKGYAKAGRMQQCFELFEELKQQGIVASQVTYGILLDGYINENQLDRAAEIFTTMSAGGCTMNTVLYTTLIKGFARAGEVQQAMKVYEQMLGERSVSPDLITFSILIKANCDIDRIDQALKLLEAMLESNLRPDEVVFNNLLSGCARQANSELGKRLYADMTASGIRPSNATFSILIRLHHQCKALDEAVEMLRVEPAKHKVDPEPRLFLQLIQSCIRERQGRRAVEVYELLINNSMPTISAHSSMITTCVKLNMFDTAAEIMAIAADRGGRLDVQDANSLLDGALRKRKTQVAKEIATSMAKLGLAVDPKLAANMTSFSAKPHIPK
jgi:pentatricopeptide repeat protein